eukprot:TRINITY_DN1434_c0_g1_i2.p1 TRINITY_DN1434_c0_g1~~TRINITY_DN1434_c0_g1_i2.p1  ORF type:complete len:155 (+),score=35.87 TRINITY_DN1434_c0_g1_i2:59-523(+)
MIRSMTNLIPRSAHLPRVATLASSLPGRAQRLPVRRERRYVHSVDRILEKNKEWRSRVLQEDPEFFARLAKGQSPEFLFIGCSDSRVSAELLTGVDVGELFVHRNIANMVVNTDISCLSVIQFAVQVLKVKHIIAVDTTIAAVCAALSRITSSV